jgi:hypothetical protein
MKYLNKQFAFAILVVLGACANKYESLYNSAPPPGLYLNKDTMHIREKDYANINWTDYGRLNFYCSSPNHQLNLQLSDTSGKVHIMYRGEDVLNRGPLPVMDSILVFCTCDTAGIYSIDCLLTDRLGKVSEKQLIVNCQRNLSPSPRFFYTVLDTVQLQNWPYRFDASFSNDPDGVIREYHFSVNGQPIVSSSPGMEYSFHAKGIHDIGLFLIDDLGKSSDTIHKQITIQ